MSASGYSPTVPIVSVESFPQIASSSLGLGLSATALFVAHQAINAKQTRSILRDIILALFASLTLATGLVFGLLACGVWF